MQIYFSLNMVYAYILEIVTKDASILKIMLSYRNATIFVLCTFINPTFGR